MLLNSAMKRATEFTSAYETQAHPSQPAAPSFRLQDAAIKCGMLASSIRGNSVASGDTTVDGTPLIFSPIISQVGTTCLMAWPGTGRQTTPKQRLNRSFDPSSDEPGSDQARTGWLAGQRDGSAACPVSPRVNTVQHADAGQRTGRASHDDARGRERFLQRVAGEAAGGGRPAPL